MTWGLGRGLAIVFISSRAQRRAVWTKTSLELK
jgi:hypothetical protein